MQEVALYGKPLLASAQVPDAAAESLRHWVGQVKGLLALSSCHLRYREIMPAQPHFRIQIFDQHVAHFQWHGGYVAGSGPKLKLDVSKQGTKDAKSKGKIKKDKMSQMSPEEYDKMLGKMKKTKKDTKDGGGRRNFIPKHVSAMITCPG